MAKKKQPENKKKIYTEGVMGLHGTTTEQAISRVSEIACSVVVP